MLNLLNLSVPPNVLLPVPAAAVVVVVVHCLPVLVLGLFVFLLPVPARCCCCTAARTGFRAFCFFTACAFLCGGSALLFYC